MTTRYELHVPRFNDYYVVRRSSLPFHLTAPNGLNFSRSVGNPKSRLERVREYLRVNGPSTRRTILRDVFGRVNVNRGWGSTFFALCVRHGFLVKTWEGGTVRWSVGIPNLTEVNPNGL